jgi:hypothetical protein
MNARGRKASNITTGKQFLCLNKWAISREEEGRLATSKGKQMELQCELCVIGVILMQVLILWAPNLPARRKVGLLRGSWVWRNTNSDYVGEVDSNCTI